MEEPYQELDLYELKYHVDWKEFMHSDSLLDKGKLWLFLKAVHKLAQHDPKAKCFFEEIVTYARGYYGLVAGLFFYVQYHRCRKFLEEEGNGHKRWDWRFFFPKWHRPKY